MKRRVYILSVTIVLFGILVSCGNKSNEKKLNNNTIETNKDSLIETNEIQGETNQKLVKEINITYSKENLVGNFQSKDNIYLKIDKEGGFSWGESGGTWSSTNNNEVFKVTFEDYYGNVTQTTISFINKDNFTLFSEEYGNENYSRTEEVDINDPNNIPEY